MSIGLGYMAQGVLQGRQQNIQNRLQEEQNKRANDANQRAAGLYPYQQRTAAADATIKEYNASDHNLGLLDRRNIANTEEAESRAGIAKYQSSGEYMDTLYQGIKAGVTGKQLYNQRTQQQVDLGAEEFTPQAKLYRSQEREQRAQLSAMDLKIKQRNEQLSQLQHNNNMSTAKQQREKLTDIDAYETIQRLRQGDKQSALRMFNGMDSNGIYDATDLSFDEEGNLHIKRQSGEDLIYPANAVGAIEQRIKSEIAKNRKAPKVQTIKKPVFGEDGKPAIDTSGEPLMQEVPYMHNPQTGQWDPISMSDDISEEEEIAVAREEVAKGNMTKEAFEYEYKVPYQTQQQVPPPPQGRGLPNQIGRPTGSVGTTQPNPLDETTSILMRGGL